MNTLREITTAEENMLRYNFSQEHKIQTVINQYQFSLEITLFNSNNVKYTFVEYITFIYLVTKIWQRKPY